MPERKPEDLTGMEPDAARDYIIGHIAALKGIEAQAAAAEADLAKWVSRVSLARSKGMEDLALQAEREAEARKARVEILDAERRDLAERIGVMRRQIPGLAARSRSIDPYLLAEELAQAAGYLSSEEADRERRFRELDRPDGQTPSKTGDPSPTVL
ncbi:MAG: chromosome partitioning protein [Spirochaetaceae bacterium]|jgi:hypothetical protein|nr:chromosome partitioning protein [Spirochaetaceae bacterium]